MNAFDALPCAVLVTDAQGLVLAANADLLALSGRTGADARPSQIDEILPPASRIFLQTHVWPTVLREGRVNEVYLQLSGPQQLRVPVMANCKREMADGAERFFWTFFVGQERLRFETALLDARGRAEAAARATAASERFTRSVTDAMPGPVAYWDRDLRCRFANRAYLDWFGVTLDELIGCPIQQLRGGRLYAANETYILAALRGQAQQFERSFKRADGEVVHTLVDYVPDVADGVVAGFLVLVNDVTQLKRAEEAMRAEMAERERVHAQLRQSSESLQEAQRLGRIGSWSWQIEPDIVTWSEELFRILGCDPALGAPGYDEQARLYQPESFAQLQQSVELCLQCGEPYALEMAYRRLDGKQGWVDARGEAVRDEQGRILRLRGTVQDITERKQIESALATESLRLANIIDGTQAGTWEWNVQTGRIVLNERSAAMLGYSLAELAAGDGQTIEFRVANTHPDDHRASWAAAKAHFSGQTEVYESEARMRHRLGHWVWILARGRVMTRTPDGKPEWMFGTHKDISQRKEQELALRKSQELLDRTGRLAGVGGWELDVASGTLSWSDETRRLHGVAPDYEPQLATAIGFYAPEVRPQVQAAVERALARGEAWDLEVPLVRADGRCIWARAVGTAEYGQGRVVRLVGAFQDITERHLLDEQLAQKTAELKRSNEELERFAYVASHDLQEPLRMVTSYGQLLARRHMATLDPEAQEFMRYMVDGGQRAQALIRDLLSLARLDSQALPWQPVALEATLAEVLQPLRLLIQECGATVTHDPLPTVRADARQMAQLLANLVGNALKFRGQRAPRVHVGAQHDGSGWRISVSDNGIGIEPRYFDRIFQMFQRLHLRSEYDGTGIGLTICKKVVERHGGRIGVDSTPGGGTTFFFTLPEPDGARAPNPNREAEAAH